VCQTHTLMSTAYTALSIASSGKNVGGPDDERTEVRFCVKLEM